VVGRPMISRSGYRGFFVTLGCWKPLLEKVCKMHLKSHVGKSIGSFANPMEISFHRHITQDSKREKSCGAFC
jgi:hypothetical protein